MLARDSRTHEEHWIDAAIAYCACGAATLVSFPIDAMPLPETGTPPGEPETVEGREWLAYLRYSVRMGPGDYDLRLAVAEAWHALDSGARLDVAWALTREERAWLALACDELLGLR